MRNIHYAWFVCLGCALLMFCTSGLTINAFTVYQPYFIENLGLSHTQASTIVTVRSLLAFLSMFLTSAYYRVLGLRWGMGAACLFTALGFAGFACADTFIGCCLAAGALGLGFGLGTMIPIAIVLGRWFSSGLALAVGICSAATGLSTLGIPSLLTWAIETMGLHAAFLGEAAFVTLCAFCVLALVRNNPASKGLKPYETNAQARAAQSAKLDGSPLEQTGETGVSQTPHHTPQHDAPAAQPGVSQTHAAAQSAPSASQTHAAASPASTMLQRRDWALIVPMLLLLGAMTIAGYSHLGVLAAGEGYAPHITAIAITASGIALTIGKISYGWAVERFGAYRANQTFGAVLTLGMLLLCLAGTSTATLAAAMIVFGFGLSMTTVGLTAWARDLSTRDTYDDTVRRFQIGCSAGGLLFSALPGMLADTFGGSYVPAYAFFLACTLFVIGAIQWLYRYRASTTASPRR